MVGGTNYEQTTHTRRPALTGSVTTGGDSNDGHNALSSRGGNGGARAMAPSLDDTPVANTNLPPVANTGSANIHPVANNQPSMAKNAAQNLPPVAKIATVTPLKSSIKRATGGKSNVKSGGKSDKPDGTRRRATGGKSPGIYETNPVVEALKASANTWVFRLRWNREPGRPVLCIARVTNETYKLITENQEAYAQYKAQLISIYAGNRGSRTLRAN